ncbi:hypothetical protein [Phormidesmis sp. 146-33]
MSTQKLNLRLETCPVVEAHDRRLVFLRSGEGKRSVKRQTCGTAYTQTATVGETESLAGRSLRRTRHESS